MTQAAYADASALVKLVVPEPESDRLRSFLRDRSLSLVSSELSLAEVPRAVRRSVTREAERRRAWDRLLAILDGLFLIPVDTVILAIAGAIGDPHLRTLDAIHLATALDVREGFDAFLSYDRRQIRAAKAARLPVVSPA